MRLFLHGRSDPAFTVQRIRSHIEQQQQQPLSQDENDSLSSIVSTSADGDVLLSGFDLDQADICEALCDLFSSSSTWSEVKLQNCHGKEGLGRVLTAILQTASVARLVLLHTNHQQSNRLSCSAAQAIGQGLAKAESCHLQSLTLKGLCLPEASMIKIARALGQPSTTLRELAIKGSFTTSEMDSGATCLERGAVSCLAQALKLNTNLEVLDLEGANVSDTSLSLLVMALVGHPCLSTLSLRGNASADKTIQALSYVLARQKKLEGTLTKLDLSAQRSSPAEADEEGEDDSTEEAPWLEWGPLFLALQSNPPALQQLILSDNHLNSNDTHDLAMALSVNTHLTELELSNCCISDRGLFALADNLSTFTGLIKLRIDGEQQTFGKKGIKRLVRSLADNFHLESLKLPSGLDNSRTLQLYLNLNRAGRKHLFPQGDDGDDEYDTDDEDDSRNSETTTTVVATTTTGPPQCALWPKILQRADRISRRHAESAQKGDEASADVLYHFLLSGFLFHL